MITATSGGQNVIINDINVRGVPSLPQWIGTIDSSTNLLKGDSIYLDDYKVNLFIANKVLKNNIYTYQLIDRTGFSESPVLLQNIIYAPGAYYAEMLYDLVDLPINFEQRFAVQSFSMTPLPIGFKKSTLINGLFDEMNMKLISDELNQCYILKARDFIPIYKIDGYVVENFSTELSPNHFTVSSNTGLTRYIYDVEDVGILGPIMSEPVTSYLLHTIEDLDNYGKKLLERSLGLRKSVLIEISENEITDLSTHLDSCWVINSQLVRVNSIDILPGKLVIRGYYADDSVYTSN